MDVDFGRTATDYSTHRSGFPDSFFERLIRMGIGIPSQRVLDLGTGTGTIARGFATRGCAVTAIDRSAAMTNEARAADERVSVAIKYLVATAEASGLPSTSFDVVTAGQCWHWFDRPRAATEVRRVLVPRGWLVIAHFDWLPVLGNVVDATERLIKVHNSSWNPADGTGLYPAWLLDVAQAGFEDIETFSYDEAIPYSHERWRGRIRASAGIGASLTQEAVARFDGELAALLKRRFPSEPMAVPHRIWVVLARAPRRSQ